MDDHSKHCSNRQKPHKKEHIYFNLNEMRGIDMFLQTTDYWVPKAVRDGGIGG